MMLIHVREMPDKAWGKVDHTHTHLTSSSKGLLFWFSRPRSLQTTRPRSLICPGEVICNNNLWGFIVSIVSPLNSYDPTLGFLLTLYTPPGKCCFDQPSGHPSSPNLPTITVMSSPATFQTQPQSVYSQGPSWNASGVSDLTSTGQ